MFSPARGHPWKSLLPIPSRKRCVHPSCCRLCHCRGVSGGKFSRRLCCWLMKNLSFQTGQAGLHKNGRSAVEFIFEECPAGTGVAARPRKEKGEKNIEEKLILIHWLHCREGAVRLWRRRFAACLMVGMTINFMCEGTSGSVSSSLVINLIGRFFFLLLAHRKSLELIIITIIITITKIIITKVGDGKRVKGVFSCFSIGRKQGRKKQNQHQLHVGNS